MGIKFLGLIYLLWGYWVYILVIYLFNYSINVQIKTYKTNKNENNLPFIYKNLLFVFKSAPFIVLK